VVGVHPHTFAVPAPSHEFGAVHEPQSSVPPQPSGMLPQFLPCATHVVGVHPHLLAVPPPPHVWGAVHPGQSSVPPHPSDFFPQSLVPHVPGVHGFALHFPLLQNGEDPASAQVPHS
jgi:hypothetical protein